MSSLLNHSFVAFHDIYELDGQTHSTNECATIGKCKVIRFFFAHN